MALEGIIVYKDINLIMIIKISIDYMLNKVEHTGYMSVTISVLSKVKSEYYLPKNVFLLATILSRVLFLVIEFKSIDFCPDCFWQYKGLDYASFSIILKNQNIRIQIKM